MWEVARRKLPLGPLGVEEDGVGVEEGLIAGPGIVGRGRLEGWGDRESGKSWSSCVLGMGIGEKGERRGSGLSVFRLTPGNGGTVSSSSSPPKKSVGPRVCLWPVCCGGSSERQGDGTRWREVLQVGVGRSDECRTKRTGGA